MPYATREAEGHDLIKAEWLDEELEGEEGIKDGPRFLTGIAQWGHLLGRAGWAALPEGEPKHQTPELRVASPGHRHAPHPSWGTGTGREKTIANWQRVSGHYPGQRPKASKPETSRRTPHPGSWPQLPPCPRPPSASCPGACCVAYTGCNTKPSRACPHSHAQRQT